jgi:DNA polymerase
MSDAAVRAQALERLAEHLRGCTRCPLSEGRTNVVVGAGDPDADLMFVGEAPGANEDRTGLPFVGQAGKLLDGLLEGIGLTREQVFIANVLKCRPPGNRDPRPDEIDACRGFLEEQVALIRPSVVCTLGNFATKLLSGSPEGISKVHGQPQPAEFAGVPVTLYPVYHPAAALYTRAMLGSLEDDFGRLAELLGVGTAAAGSSALAEADAARPDAPRSADDPASRQLDLF